MKDKRQRISHNLEEITADSEDDLISWNATHPKGIISKLHLANNTCSDSSTGRFKPPDMSYMNRKLKMKFYVKEKRKHDFFCGQIVSYDGMSGKYVAYFPSDGEVVFIDPDDKDVTYLD